MLFLKKSRNLRESELLVVLLVACCCFHITSKKDDDQKKNGSVSAGGAVARPLCEMDSNRRAGNGRILVEAKRWPSVAPRAKMMQVAASGLLHATPVQ